MPIPIEEEVRAVVGPMREAKLRWAYHQAWTDVSADQAKYSIWPRTRANMMFERLAVRLQEAFADDKGVRFFFADETVKIAFDDVVLARCKKANDRCLGQNVETQAVITFCEAQEELPGFPGLQKIEILYVVNRVSTAIKTIMVQARDGDMRLWAYPIDDVAGGGTAEIIQLPIPPAPPSPPDGSDLVHPREKPADKEESDETEQ